jgi:hypothetical protein
MVVDKLSVDEMDGRRNVGRQDGLFSKVDKLSVDEMSVDEISVDELLVDKLPLYQRHGWPSAF